jgi:hypothetical protein
MQMRLETQATKPQVGTSYDSRSSSSTRISNVGRARSSALLCTVPQSSRLVKPCGFVWEIDHRVIIFGHPEVPVESLRQAILLALWGTSNRCTIVMLDSKILGMGRYQPSLRTVWTRCLDKNILQSAFENDQATANLNFVPIIPRLRPRLRIVTL